MSRSRKRQNYELWLKEAIINAAVARLPSDWKYVAWVDADVKLHQKRETKNGAWRQEPEHISVAQIPHMETKLFLRNAAVPGGATICGQKAGDACSPLMRGGVFSDNIALSGASKRGVP